MWGELGGERDNDDVAVGRHLLRHEAEPGWHVARPTERFTVSGGRNQRGCAKDADAGYRGQPVRRLVGARMLGQIVVQSVDPYIE